MNSEKVKIGKLYVAMEGRELITVRVIEFPKADHKRKQCRKFGAVVQDGSGRHVKITPARLVREVREAQGPADCSKSFSHPLLPEKPAGPDMAFAGAVANSVPKLEDYLRQSEIARQNELSWQTLREHYEKAQSEKALAKEAEGHDYECDKCGGVFNGEPGRVDPPKQSSPDGLPIVYCPECTKTIELVGSGSLS